MEFPLPQKNRKFRINQKFAPVSLDEGDEYFANGIFEFNITKLSHYIDNKSGNFPAEFVDIEEFTRFSSKTLNEETIRTADLANPILVAELRPGIFNVIDGNHRVEKAKRQGIKKILAKRVLAETHINFLTSFKSYESYVRYWNEKIAEVDSP